MSKQFDQSLAARAEAVRLLTGVVKDHQQMSDLLSDMPDLPPADRARAQRLAITSLRFLGQADAVLAHFVERLPPMPALNVMRLAVVELCHEKRSRPRRCRQRRQPDAQNARWR